MWYWIIYLLLIFITVVFFLIWVNNNRIRLTSPMHPDHESYSSYVSVLNEHSNEDQQYATSPSLSFTKHTVSHSQSIVKNKPIIVKDNVQQYNSSKIIIKEKPLLHIDKKEHKSIIQDSTPIIQDSTPIIQESTLIVQRQEKESTPIVKDQIKEKESTPIIQRQEKDQIKESTPIVQRQEKDQIKEKETKHPFTTLITYAEETVLERQYPKDNGPVPEKVCLSCLTGF